MSEMNLKRTIVFGFVLMGTVVEIGFVNESIADELATVEPGNAKVLRQYAARHRLQSTNDASRTVEMLPQPVLAWTNPTRGDVFGGIFLWVDGRRPIAYGGMFVWMEQPQKKLGREFHVLSPQLITATFDNQAIWSPNADDFQYQSVPNLELRSTTTELRRLRSMKQLASRFKIEISNRDVNPEQARLLPTPIYRYADPEADIVDGAMFAFVQGNDPEVLLIVEAIGQVDKNITFRYAIARCTTWAVDASFDGTSVYAVPRYEFHQPDRKAAFIALPRVSVQ